MLWKNDRQQEDSQATRQLGKQEITNLAWPKDYQGRKCFEHSKTQEDEKATIVRQAEATCLAGNRGSQRMGMLEYTTAAGGDQATRQLGEQKVIYLARAKRSPAMKHPTSIRKRRSGKLRLGEV